MLRVAQTWIKTCDASLMNKNMWCFFAVDLLRFHYPVLQICSQSNNPPAFDSSCRPEWNTEQPLRLPGGAEPPRLLQLHPPPPPRFDHLHPHWCNADLRIPLQSIILHPAGVFQLFMFFFSITEQLSCSEIILLYIYRIYLSFGQTKVLRAFMLTAIFLHPLYPCEAETS